MSNLVNKNEQAYLDLLRDVLVNGDRKEDRTGVGTISVFGRMIRFDLSTGFPLLTTKQVAWKGVVSELLWFLEGSGDERRLAEIRFNSDRECLEDKSTIWTENSTAPYWVNRSAYSGDLGPIYGVMWRKWPVSNGEICLIDKREFVKEEPFFPSDFMKKIACETIPSDLDGLEFESSDGELWRVVGKKDDKGKKNSTLLLRHKDGTELLVSRPNLKMKEFNHPYLPSVRGVGCLGRRIPKQNMRPYHYRAYNMWNAMLARCYDPTHPEYPAYGAVGVTVSPKWKCFETFIKSLPNVPLFHKWVQNRSDEIISLDKDYFGSKSYSEKTCIFLDQRTNASFGRPCIDDKNRLYSSIGSVARFFNASDSTVQANLEKGSWTDTITGTVVRPFIPPEGKLVRPKKFVDQIEELIKELKTNPNSRRHILVAWNPGEVSLMALPPCHIEAQFVVSDGRLSCLLNMRSVDLGLGLPFNIASYALLTKMIAQVCSLDVGELVVSTGDTHIYLNHLDLVETVLSRDPHSPPTVTLDPNVTEIEDFTMESFTLMNYKYHPPIKAPMAV